MRGSPQRFLVLLNQVGIIPAHAGLTNPLRLLCQHSRDHPRACGAHTASMLISHVFWGSSPRMRGSLSASRICRPDRGIIPAHAGLTHGSARRRRLLWDHPRACGAHATNSALRRTFSGSSPRMRGSRRLQISLVEKWGIIPAHAGLTSSCTALPQDAWDHPRACGAHS